MARRRTIRSSGAHRPRVRSPRCSSQRLTCPLVGALSSAASSLAHLTASAPFRVRPPGSVSGRLSTTTSRRTLDIQVMVSRCPSAAGIRFSVILCPPGNWALLTVGLPANDRTQTGLPRSARSRCDRGGRPLLPGGGGALSRPTTIIGLHPTHPSAVSLHPATTIHPCGAPHDEPSTEGSHKFARPTFPSPVTGGWIASPSAFPRASHPTITHSARRGGDGSK